MNPEEAAVSAAWWSARRLRFNIGLAAAGVGAFIALCGVVEVFSDYLPEVEITIFSIVFQGFAYLVCMAVANACYQLGPLSERWLEPRNPTAYRRLAFAVGFWFSVSLPFSAPVLLVISALHSPAHPQP